MHIKIDYPGGVYEGPNGRQYPRLSRMGEDGSIAEARRATVQEELMWELLMTIKEMAVDISQMSFHVSQLHQIVMDKEVRNVR